MSGDWRSELRLKLEDFVDHLVVHGAKQREVCEAIKQEIEALESAYERDPDPADDIPGEIIEEPSNDWPSS